MTDNIECVMEHLNSKLLWHKLHYQSLLPSTWSVNKMGTNLLSNFSKGQLCYHGIVHHTRYKYSALQ